MDDTNARPRVQSLARGLALLTEVGQHPGALTAAELSDRTGLTRQVTYHLLHTLRATGFVQVSAGQRYELGLAFHSLAQAGPAPGNPESLGAGYLRALATLTQESCSMSTWQGDDVVVVDQAPGAHAVRVADVHVGQRGDLHARASGKLLLAHASPERFGRVFDRLDLRRLTPATKTDPAALRAEFDTIRADGFAMDREEFTAGVTCVAARAVVAGTELAFTVLAPTGRFSPDYVRDAMAVAARASLNV
ncbi:IclR family transcriptional regulator [Dactylosporangium sp. CA-092794]|uniref:IclR family transcriptional regulator n=1 Tax=Dactylosporangium sp. CA-092794 TaxID=3239929 RepID=UPI003D90F324